MHALHQGNVVCTTRTRVMHTPWLKCTHLVLHALCTPMSILLLMLLRLAVALIVDSRRTIASGFARRSVSDFAATTRQALIGSNEFFSRSLPVSFPLRRRASLVLLSRNLLFFPQCYSQKHDGTRTKITPTCFTFFLQSISQASSFMLVLTGNSV